VKRQQVLGEARKRGYIVARSNAQEQHWAREYYRECERDRHPYARVTPRSTWAAVEVDMDPAGQRLPKKTIRLLGEEIATLYAELPTRARGWYVYGNHTHVPKVPIERAEALVTRLLGIVNQYLEAEVIFGPAATAPAAS